MPAFQLLKGLHFDTDPADVALAKAANRLPKDRTYRPGDTVVSDSDLERRFGDDKFRRLHEGQEGVPAAPTARLTLAQQAERLEKHRQETLLLVNGMGLDQLRDFAADEEIDLKGAKDLDATRRVVRQALGGK